MSRFFFDLHSDSLSTWDDDGVECDTNDEIAHHALKHLAEAAEDSTARGSHAVVSVRNKADRAVLTATYTPFGGPRVEWSDRKPGKGAGFVPNPPSLSGPASLL
ncbi:DUF6894 family protein [Methylobacterium nigriterrae]|uniref:DUF6894 family protein n=1 Tax=Methylobacterium nigriterrae TaxID=3127512 RepID=UPI00301343FD